MCVCVCVRERERPGLVVDGCWIVGHLMCYGFCVWWWWVVLVVAVLFVLVIAVAVAVVNCGGGWLGF